MSHRFRIGDRVEWLGVTHDLGWEGAYVEFKGARGIITALMNDIVRVRWEGRFPGYTPHFGWYEHRFKLVEEDPAEAAVREYIRSELT